MYVADTNLISETNRIRPDRRVAGWLSEIDQTSLYTTAVNIAELRAGVYFLTDIARANALTAWIEQIRIAFASRILPADENALVLWRKLTHRQQVRRLPNPPVDLLICAIAMTNNQVIATRDVAPFVAAGAAVFNPWTGEMFEGKSSA
jgi:toxin FitB